MSMMIIALVMVEYASYVNAMKIPSSDVLLNLMLGVRIYVEKYALEYRAWSNLS